MRIVLPLRPFYAINLNPIIVVFLFMIFLCSVPMAEADTTVGGTIAADTTWVLAESPYIVSSSITVKGTDGADGITTLTIEPGVEVRMTKYSKFFVGASSGDPGALLPRARLPIPSCSPPMKPRLRLATGTI